MNNCNQIGRSLIAALTILSASAQASTFTSTSPSGGATAGVTPVGGIVVDLAGTNGAHIVSQLSGQNLFSGYASTSTFTVGVQSGYTPSVLSVLGGSLASAAVRFTLYDGDTSPGNFDATDLTLALNGVSFGNWGAIQTQTTDANGVATNNATHLGFGDGLLDTGWFKVTDAAALTSLHNSLGTQGSLTFTITDKDPSDNNFDFRQGVSSSLLSASQAPTFAASSVPEPESYAMMLFGLAAVTAAAKRRSRQSTVLPTAA